MPMKPKVTARKITDYRPDPANPNEHTERGTAILDNSLSEVGLGRSIVVDKNGIVLAGNSTQERAVDQGFEDAIEIETDGHQLIVVRRNDLDLLNDTDNRARQLSFYDNRAAEIGIQWDMEQLQASLNAGVDLSRMFSQAELDALLEQYNAEPAVVQDTKDGKIEPNVPEFRVEIICTRADLEIMQSVLDTWSARPGVIVSIAG